MTNAVARSTESMQAERAQSGNVPVAELAVAQHSRPELETPYEAPDEAEERAALCAIWETLLGSSPWA